jgi:8-oxo-dGTP diphosphatase
MHDVTELAWLPLERAVKRLSRDHERAFLENVGPLALRAAHAAAEVDAVDPLPEPAVIEAEQDTRNGRRSLVRKVTDWLRLPA